MCPNYQSHNYYTNDKIQINKITSSEIKLKLRLRTATLKIMHKVILKLYEINLIKVDVKLKK